MKTVLTLSVLVIALWMMSLSGIDLQNTFFFWRGQLTQITGEIAICLMAVLLMMATRPRWLEKVFGGLDKLYKAHKTIGISAGVMTIMHWAVTKSPGWLSALGLLTLGPRSPHHGSPDHVITSYSIHYTKLYEMDTDMQALIRSSHQDDFPMVDYFIHRKNSGELRAPEQVAGGVYKIIQAEHKSGERVAVSSVL